MSLMHDQNVKNTDELWPMYSGCILCYAAHTFPHALQFSRQQ